MNSIIPFILEHAEAEPVHKRIHLYLDLLLFLPRDSSFKKLREEITEIVESLQRAQELSQQLNFTFQQSAATPEIKNQKS